MQQLKGIVAFSCKFYVAPLFGLFFIADLIYYPQLKYEFLAYRIATMAGALVAGLIAQRTMTLFSTQVACSFVTLICDACLHTMIFRIGVASTPYYAGLILTTMGMAIGYRYTWPLYWVNLAMCNIPFIAFAAAHPKDQWGLLSALFLTGVGVIGTVSRAFQEHLYLLEFQSRQALEDEVAARGKTIEQKTKEALEMSQLAKQFSPQVVESIKLGELNISKPVHHTEIAVIFIDIVGSTERFIRLDREELHEVLSLFMEDAMESLLSNDLTIDKFLGDGVLGFSNDPIKHSDFIERAVAAGLSTIRAIKEKQRLYDELWLAPFNVGIGIASGNASVGFYGSDKHLRNYTAIGRPVNLASRLASIAEPGKLLLSHECVRSMQKHSSPMLAKLNIVDLGRTNIKGFEKDSIRVFEVSESPSSRIDSPSGKAASPICPFGHGELLLDINQRGLFTYCCSKCRFELDKDSQGINKSAA